MSLGFVLMLSVLSQVINVGLCRIWGRLADRFSNKSVLTVSGWMFIISILLWPFLTLPEKHLMTIPLLIVIHILAGISTAGINLCSGNIALKAAPQGKATRLPRRQCHRQRRRRHAGANSGRSCGGLVFAPGTLAVAALGRRRRRRHGIRSLRAQP